MYQIGYFLPVAAAILLAGVDAYRIANNMGGGNIPKSWTYFYGGLGYCLCLIISLDYYTDFGIVDALLYFTYYSGIRMVVYAPALNLMRGLEFDYFSKTTNSWVDGVTGSFWILLLLGVAVSVITGIIMKNVFIIS